MTVLQLAGFQHYSPKTCHEVTHFKSLIFFCLHCKTHLRFIFSVLAPERFLVSQSLVFLVVFFFFFLLPFCIVLMYLLCQGFSFIPAVVFLRDFGQPGWLRHAEPCLAEGLNSFSTSTVYCTQRHQGGEISFCLSLFF